MSQRMGETPGQRLSQTHFPGGGLVTTLGLTVDWSQCRPLTVVAALIDRFEYLEKTAGLTQAQREALTDLRKAEGWLSREYQEAVYRTQQP